MSQNWKNSIWVISERGSYTYDENNNQTGYLFQNWNDPIWVNWTKGSYTHDGKNNLPDNFSLEQNYPNPFNPTTVISYSIPKTSMITIKIYDILGNEVANLMNEEKSAGRYSVNFNGSKLSSGVYFYRMQAGSFVETKKNNGEKPLNSITSLL